AEQQRRAAQCDEPGVAVGGGRPIAPIRPPWADRGPLAAIDRNPPVSERIAAASAAASVEEPAGGAAGGAAERAVNHPRVAVLEGLLEGRWAGTSPLDSHVVLFDPQGRGMVAVAHGDLATAARVAIYVPGTGADLDRAARDLQRGLALADAGRALAPATAVITWIGYRTPEFIVPVSGDGTVPWTAAAVSPQRASAGASALASFVRRLDLRDEVDVSLVGHSYGSLVAAGAARELGGVDTLVLVGSPGVGVDHAAELHADAVYSFAASGDVVAALPVFGENPDSMSFGAIRVDLRGHGSGSAVGAVAGHSSYFEPGSRSLEQLALIVSGQGGAVDRAAFDWSDWLVGTVRAGVLTGPIGPIGPIALGPAAVVFPDPVDALRAHLSPGSRLASILEGVSAGRAVVNGAIEGAAEWTLEELAEFATR
ncbi:MAG: hypothetical protein GX868_12420, partial [Actinobacteria bacterium]|nr:hypothetical protein [Actinomycetota bacterium]